MQYGKLSFQEISDDQTQAVVHLNSGYQIQVLYNRPERLHDCKLYDPRGTVADSEEGVNIEGVTQFIERCEELIQEIDETMCEMAGIELMEVS